VALIETQGSAVHVLPAAAAALADWLHLFARPKAREELWGVDGIAQRCGVSRSTVYNWASKPGFPAPVPVVGGNGPVWEARAVKAWVKLARSKGGRPKKAARRS
jgi:predicted DNA-binding transcriptional regulator AlpA